MGEIRRPESWKSRGDSRWLPPGEGGEMARHTPANERAEALTPSVSLLSKIGSIAVHSEELLSSGGHAFDKIAIEQLLRDPEVREWLRAMKEYLPVKR
jgi:hypothetical protein